MKKIIVETKKKKEIIDITNRIGDELEKKSGLCHLFLLHTTAALTTADLDPGTDLDMLDAFEKIMPKLKYRHPHDPGHAPDHILSSMIGPSIVIPVLSGRMVLGQWQRLVLIELDGPRKREIRMSFIEEK
ncbi:MAG TPA: secondary thiamine-phosphate synthase enzyme YjbQ [Patescibacteria group bacterium]|jgi:secondary thiamine-phosphate synthase enzyme|nr:secondary thiamine-phosphate synthase enzyme YjbQ [Patescibacteria group bacterium]